MSLSFADLKKNSKKSLETLNQEVQKISSKKTYQDDDERFWKPTLDEAKNASAVIRFLPAPKEEDIPWVRIFSHGFKGPTGQWYFENSLTTLGKADPCYELNGQLYNAGDEDSKKQASAQNRVLTFYANILVIKDPEKPQNNGKVFLYKFPKTIFNMLNEYMNPEDEDTSPSNPFDFWEGRNFKLEIRNKGGFRNYDKSKFLDPSKIADTDEEIEAIWNQEHSLQQFLDPKNFKSYDELKARLDVVLGLVGRKPAKTEEKPKDDDDVQKEVKKPEPKVEKKATVKESAPVEDTQDDDDESIAFFKDLADKS
jgi:hypothetical protein